MRVVLALALAVVSLWSLVLVSPVHGQTDSLLNSESRKSRSLEDPAVILDATQPPTNGTQTEPPVEGIPPPEIPEETEIAVTVEPSYRPTSSPTGSPLQETVSLEPTDGTGGGETSSPTATPTAEPSAIATAVSTQQQTSQVSNEAEDPEPTATPSTTTPEPIPDSTPAPVETETETQPPSVAPVLVDTPNPVHTSQLEFVIPTTSPSAFPTSTSEHTPQLEFVIPTTSPSAYTTTSPSAAPTSAPTPVPVMIAPTPRPSQLPYESLPDRPTLPPVSSDPPFQIMIADIEQEFENPEVDIENKTVNEAAINIALVTVIGIAMFCLGCCCTCFWQACCRFCKSCQGKKTRKGHERLSSDHEFVDHDMDIV